MLCKLEVAKKNGFLDMVPWVNIQIEKFTKAQKINRAGPYSFEVDRSNGFNIGKKSNRWMDGQTDRPACPITKYPTFSGV